MTDSYTFKKFSKTEFLEEIPDNATLLIEDGGDIKRVPASQVGGTDVQANLDQNDPDAPDYVKGRLCYREKIAEVDLPGGQWFEHDTPLVVGEKYSVFIAGDSINPNSSLIAAEAVEFYDGTIGFDAEIPAFEEFEPYMIRVRTDAMRIDFNKHVIINRLKQLPNDLIPDNIARLDNLQIHMVDKSNFIFADVLLAYEAGKVILCDDGWEILTLCGGVPLSTNVAARYFDFSNIDPASGTVNCIRIKGDNTYQRTTYKIALTQT